MTLIGTLPGRKPGTLARRAVCCRLLSTADSMRSAGTPTVIRRSRAEVASTETCMDFPRCTDVVPAVPAGSRACILVAARVEVTPRNGSAGIGFGRVRQALARRRIPTCQKSQGGDSSRAGCALYTAPCASGVHAGVHGALGHGQLVAGMNQSALQRLRRTDETGRGEQVAAHVHGLLGAPGTLVDDLLIEGAILVHAHGVFPHARMVDRAMQRPVEGVEQKLAETTRRAPLPGQEEDVAHRLDGAQVVGVQRDGQ